MTLDERITESEQKFNTQQAQREGLLKQAEECLTEMAKLQGEWRLLKELINEVSEPVVSVNNESTSKKGNK